MKSSENIAALAAALSAFQGEAEDAKKKSKAHQYMYADLPTLLQLVRPGLKKNGLAVVQFPVSGNEQLGVATRLMHESGEWIEEEFLMPVQSARNMSDAQASGCTVTYFHRYALAACLGISQEDDDGATALPKPEPKATSAQKRKIHEHKEKGTLPERWVSWCGKANNWSGLTQSQAESILFDCEKKEKAA